MGHDFLAEVAWVHLQQHVQVARAGHDFLSWQAPWYRSSRLHLCVLDTKVAQRPRHTGSGGGGRGGGGHVSCRLPAT